MLPGHGWSARPSPSFFNVHSLQGKHLQHQENEADRAGEDLLLMVSSFCFLPATFLAGGSAAWRWRCGNARNPLLAFPVFFFYI